MRILDNCIKNNDSFSWRELNCYHKPFATAFKTYNEIYFDAYLLLVSYLSVYAVKNKNNEEYTFIEVYEKYLKDFFEIKIKKVDFNNKVDMALKIKSSIDSGAPVIIPVNIIELKYNPMYKIESHHKNMVIKGYDFSRELIYILDNSHDDFGSSTILSDFVSDINEIYNMAIAYGRVYEQLKDNSSYFYSIQLCSLKAKSISYMDILDLLKKLILRTKLPNDDLNKLFIRNPELKLLLCNSKIMNKKDDEVDHILKTINFKNVFYQTLFKIIKMCNEKYADDIRLESEEIEKLWNDIKFKLVFKILSKNEIYEDIQPDIDNIMKLENNFYKKLITILEKIKSQDIVLERNKEITGYYIKNNQNAEISSLDNKINIKLSDDKTYDIWTGSDNGVQLLCKDSTDIKIFSINMDIIGEIGDSYQCGIVIKLSDGKKILFGSTNGNHISVFVPDLKEKFEIYHQLNEHALKNVKIKIKINNDKISFFHIYNENHVCVNEMKICNSIVEVGLFVKSWVKTRCEVNFSKMEIERK